jgi:hypothetical protein
MNEIPPQNPSLYDRLFQHISQLKVVAIVTSPRAGSDFFQSLLDGHPEILQVTGQFRFYDFWREALCKDNLSDLIQEFAWHRAYLPKFNSRYEKEERWDQLGELKSEHFEVDLDQFKSHLICALQNKPLTGKNFFLAVHLAYFLAAGKTDIFRAKILVCHVHEYYRLAPLQKDFEDLAVIYCTRDPRNGLVSTVENLMRDHGQMNLVFFKYWLSWIFAEAEQALPYSRQIKALPLERLHERNKILLKEFCRDFGLQFDQCLLKSTYHNKQWWGDLRSKKDLKGFLSNVGDKKWAGKLTGTDVLLIEFLLHDRMKAYGYPLTFGQNPAWFLVVPFLIWLPMKYELRIAWEDLKKPSAFRHRVTNLGSSLGQYLARVALYYRYYAGRIRGTLFVADHY